MSKKPRVTPTYKSRSGRFLEYAELVSDAKKAPLAWFLAYPSAPHATYKAIRGRYHRDLQQPDGVLDAQFRNEHIGDQGRRGDVWCRWVPNTEEN